jgi:glutamate formiminotransferase/formiminotetrahydrofolate cyclodeaminase
MNIIWHRSQLILITIKLPPHIVFEECVKDAKEMKLAVCGSELVGLIPLEAMLMAAGYYIDKEDLFILDERQKIRLVIDRLGLSSVSQFIPEKRIIEYMIKEKIMNRSHL